MNVDNIPSQEGNAKNHGNAAIGLPKTLDKPKRGISVGSFRMSNEVNIISTENKKILLNKVITQVDKDNSDNGKIQDNCLNHRGVVHNSLSPQRNLSDSLSKLLPPKTTNKKTLVLDLDETLVHSSFVPFQRPSDIIIKVEIEGQIYDIHVLVRPGVDDFLNKMAEKFELIIFTASLSKYANPLMNIIDKEGRCIFRLFREHCTLVGTSYVKDLKRLNRNLKEIIILDNSPLSYSLNRDNGFPIISWFDDKSDKELIDIIPILDFLAEVPDVRNFIPKMVINNEISYSKALNLMNNFYSFQQSNPLNSNLLSANQHPPNHHSSEKSNCRGNTAAQLGPVKYLTQKMNTSTTKEKPQINIKIINNNITNLIVNSGNTTSNPLSISAIKKQSYNEDNNTSKKHIQKEINTFRKNPVLTDLNTRIPSIITSSEAEIKQPNKHKKVESFTFGLNKCGFLSGLKNKNINNNNRQISLKTNNKIINDNYPSGVIDLKKKSDLENQILYLRNKNINLSNNSNNIANTDSSRPSTSLKLTNKTLSLKDSYINRTPSSHIFAKCGTSPHAFNKTGQHFTYNFTEKINTVRPITSKGKNYKILKRSLKPSNIKELKLDYSDTITNKFYPNYSSTTNTQKK